jgi:hypothetical protein
MSDLLDEVQQDLQEERYGRLIAKVIRIFMILAILVLIFTIIYSWKNNKNSKLQYELSASFNKALNTIEANNFNDSIPLLDQIISHSDQQYAALASLQKSSILLKQNQYKEAQDLLLNIAQNNKYDSALRDLAKITFLGNQLKTNSYDDAQTKELFSKLLKENNPWYLSALQLKALYELKDNNSKEAEITLNKIIDSQQASKYSHDTAASILSVISRSQTSKK